MALVAIAALRLSSGMDRPLTGDALRYAAISGRMLESGDGLHPQNGGRPYFAKPPLAFWTVAASLGAFGTSPEAAMLPSILAGIGVVVAVFLIARRHGGDVAGWVAALSLLFLPSFVKNTTTCRLESILLLASLGALFAFERARERPAWFLAAWALVGVAVMTKGAPGLAPLAVLAGAALLARDPFPFASRAFWIAFPAALLVAGPWYVHMTLLHGGAFWHGALESEVVDRLARSSGSVVRLVRDSLEYPAYLVVPAIPGAWWAWRDGRTNPALRRAAALAFSWIALVLAGQAVNPGGFARYMYATLPAFAGLSGYAVARVVAGRGKPAAIPAAVAVAAVVFLALRVAGVPGFGHRQGDAPHQAVLAAVDRLLPEGPVLSVVGEPTDATNFLEFHRGRAIRAVAPGDLATVLPAAGAAPVPALADDRALPAVLAAGATEVVHGNVYSVVRFDPPAR